MTALRLRALLVGLLAALVGVAGCGLSEDADPQAIAPENVPPGLLDPNPSSSTTLPESGATTTISVFYLTRDGDRTRLAAVDREVNASEASSPGSRITALLARPTSSEQDRGFTTSIPADTVLLNATLPTADGQELVINLSAELFDVQGQELANAFAQIVWTVSEVAGVRQVRFQVEGVAVPALDADGTEQTGAVTIADYRSLAPG